jgi:hypothetical protein
MNLFSKAAPFFLLAACNQQFGDNSTVLQNQIDSLRTRIDHVYTPGLGEYMSSIQTHHAKRWFA